MIQEKIDISEEYLKYMRDALRITGTKFDSEIKVCIDSARKDLQMAGILNKKIADESDNLIKRSISIYIKSEFGLENGDSFKYHESYERQKIALALSSEYTKEGDEDVG